MKSFFCIILTNFILNQIGAILTVNGFGSKVNHLSEFPHHVQIAVNDQYCSGSIISNRWILSSYFCLNAEVDSLKIYFSRYVLEERNNECFEVKVPSSAVIPYPTLIENLALIKLPIILTFNQNIQPIRLPNADENLLGKTVVMPGYEIENNSKNFKFSMFQVVPDTVCGVLNFGNTNTYELSGRSFTGKISEKDNIGSGLVLNWHKTGPQNYNYLVGLLTGSSGDCYKFIQISKYLVWINFITGLGPLYPATRPTSTSTTVRPTETVTTERPLTSIPPIQNGTNVTNTPLYTTTGAPIESSTDSTTYPTTNATVETYVTSTSTYTTTGSTIETSSDTTPYPTTNATVEPSTAETYSTPTSPPFTTTDTPAR